MTDEKCYEVEYNVIDNALSSQFNVVLKYEHEFGTKVNFSELQNTMKTICESPDDNKGTADSNMYQSCGLNVDIQHAYTRSVDQMGKYCKWMNRTLESLFKYIEEENLTHYLATPIYSMSFSLLRGAQDLYLGHSLNSFKFVQTEIINLKKLLNATLSDLRNDSNLSNFYKEQKQVQSEKKVVRSQFLDEKINNAIEIAARFNANLTEDETKINELAKLNTHKNLNRRDP